MMTAVRFVNSHPSFHCIRPAALAVLVLIAAWLHGFGLASAATFETPARHAIMVDYDTGAVLFEKNADEPMPPASMSKMMTIYVLFDRLKNGNLSLDDTFSVSEKAWRKGGSKMFVEVGKRVRVEDLLRGIVVQSGNDASIVVAEGLSGSEDQFAEELNRMAKEIGLSASNFANSTGWPDPEQYMTARDLATLAIRTIQDFPDLYGYYRETNYVFAGIKQGNRNPLLYRETGADGLKTGHTEEAGYGLTASAIRGGRRLVMVLTGLDSKRQRSSESERFLDWGFREFNNYSLFKSGENVLTADVWLGEAPTVDLLIDRPVTLTMPRRSRRDMKVTAVFDNPIPAPISAGDAVGRVLIEAPNLESIEVPLRAGANVPQLGTIGRLHAAVSYLLWGGSAD